MLEKVYLTKKGLDKLKAELKELTGTKRVEIALRIKNARDMGDISENSEYDAAREEQAIIEGRITELEEIIKNAIVSTTQDKNKVYVGARVTVHVDGEEEHFHLVGAPEADPNHKKVSLESPLGKALLGKVVGNKVEVDAPVGKITYTILKIE